MRRDVGLARVPDVVWLACLCSCSPRRAPPSSPSPHRWALPEYHKLVLAFLASYKPYVSADALLEHLTTLYTYLTLDVERRELCTASAEVTADELRAARTVRERVLYVLLLWLRRHPDDFEASYWAPGTGASASFVVSGVVSGASRLRSLSSFVHDALTVLADETRGPPAQISSEITSEVGRYLTALERLIRSQRDPSEITSEITSEIPARPSGGGRPQHGLNYWERLLNTAPSGSERALVRELAEQLSVLETALFRAVRPSERHLMTLMATDDLDCL